MKCLGCGGSIPWNGRGVFAYTCSCGATIFYDGKTSIHPPASLVIGLAKKRELPHIDYYLGKSSHTSHEKEEMYDFLRSKGCVWSWECERCKFRTIERIVYEVANKIYRFGIHPALKEAIAQAIEKEESVVKG
jgi:hypothetical protein